MFSYLSSKLSKWWFVCVFCVVPMIHSIDNKIVYMVYDWVFFCCCVIWGCAYRNTGIRQVEIQTHNFRMFVVCGVFFLALTSLLCRAVAFFLIFYQYVCVCVCIYASSICIIFVYIYIF